MAARGCLPRPCGCWRRPRRPWAEEDIAATDLPACACTPARVSSACEAAHRSAVLLAWEGAIDSYGDDPSAMAPRRADSTAAYGAAAQGRAAPTGPSADRSSSGCRSCAQVRCRVSWRMRGR